MKKRVKGMTLIEMIISLSILTIIVGVIYIFFFSSNRILSDADINEELQSDAQRIEYRLSKDGMESSNIWDMFDVNSSDDKSGVPIPEGFKNAYGTGTPDKYRVKDGIQTSEIYGGRTYVEYYSENDITNRRAKEILEMIKSGQLVFFDKDIFDKNDLEDTKLVKNFANASGDNVIKVNRNEITIQNIVDKYFDNNVVKEKDFKPEIKMQSMTEGIKDTSKDSDRNIEAEFVVSTGNAVQDGDKVKIDLYLDFNGDTLFRGTDSVYSTYGTVDKGEVQCKINYEITKEFVYSRWKKCYVYS